MPYFFIKYYVQNNVSVLSEYLQRRRWSYNFSVNILVGRFFKYVENDWQNETHAGLHFMLHMKWNGMLNIHPKWLIEEYVENLWIDIYNLPNYIDKIMII